MTAEQTLYRILDGDTSIQGLVDGRIYQDIIPQPEDLPAIVYSRSGTEPVQTIHGANIASFAQIGIQAWAKSRSSAESVSSAICAALNAEGEAYTAKGAIYDEEAKCYGVTIDVTIFET